MPIRVRSPEFFDSEGCVGKKGFYETNQMFIDIGESMNPLC